MHIKLLYNQVSQEIYVVSNSKIKEDIPYTITTNNGKLVRQGKIANGQIQNTISTNGMPNGNYLVKVSDKELRFEKRNIFQI